MALNTCKSDIIYPFIQQMDIAFGLISDIRIALKQSRQTPFISSISCGNGSLSLVLETQSSYLGCFQYVGNEWITLDNAQVFGVIRLSTVPVQVYSAQGKWYIDRRCYSFCSDVGGISQLYVTDLKCRPQTTLNLVINGQVQVQHQSGSTVNVVPKSDPYQCIEQKQLSTPYISTVNGNPVKYLDIHSADQDIIIQGPTRLTDNLYQIVVNSGSGFPTCPQWEQQD